MPGFFATVQAPNEVSRRLQDEFTSVWNDAVIHTGAGWAVGAHAHRKQKGIARVGGDVLVVDGEPSAYRLLAREAASAQSSRAIDSDCVVQLTGEVVATWAALDTKTGSLTICNDPSGAFPLYWAHCGDGIAVSTHLRPLARALGASVDMVGVLQFVQSAATIGKRSLFDGINRLRSGETLRYRHGASITSTFESPAWLQHEAHEHHESEEQLWNLLCDATIRASSGGPRALMMSGGWDSRTLLAAAHTTASPLRAYSHGDIHSRELTLVQGICLELGVPCQLEPIDDQVFDASLLSAGAARTETLSFPHWHRAGQLLSAAGFASVSAGVLGEVLGGHYGPAMLGSASSRVRALLGSLLPAGGSTISPHLDASTTLRSAVPTGIPWYLASEYASVASEARVASLADVDQEVERHRSRGVQDDATLIEAFISEQRGAQYIVAQSRSCRAWTDVDMPLAALTVFIAASRLPLARRVHNRLNRQLLLRHAPSLLRFPMAATLLPASAPILLQEASRAVRKLGEATSKRWNVRRPAAGLGWVNFDFLAHSDLFEQMATQLRNDLWSREGIQNAIRQMRAPDATVSRHALFDQLNKLCTVDFLLS